MNNWAGLYTKLQRARIKLQNIFPKAIIQMWRGFILIFWESQVTRGLILNSCLFCCSIKLFHQIVFHLLMVLLHWQLNTLQIIVLICKRDPDLGKDSSAQCHYLENFKSKCLVVMFIQNCFPVAKSRKLLPRFLMEKPRGQGNKSVRSLCLLSWIFPIPEVDTITAHLVFWYVVHVPKTMMMMDLPEGFLRIWVW